MNCHCFFFSFQLGSEEGLNMQLPNFTYLSHPVSSNPQPPQNWGLVSGAHRYWACFLLLSAPLPGPGLRPATLAEAHWVPGAATGAQDGQSDQKPHNPEECNGPLHPSDKWGHWNPEKCHDLPQLCPITWHKSEDLRLRQDVPERTFSSGLTSRQRRIRKMKTWTNEAEQTSTEHSPQQKQKTHVLKYTLNIL